MVIGEFSGLFICSIRGGGFCHSLQIPFPGELLPRDLIVSEDKEVSLELYAC